MQVKKYDKYIVRKARFENLPFEGVLRYGEDVGGKTPGRTFMSSDDVEKSKVHIIQNLFLRIPTPNPYVLEHVHPYDEVLFFLGTNPDDLDDLDAEVDVYIEDEPYTITTSSAIYLPAGVKHCPIVYKRVGRPHMFFAISLNGVYEGEDR